jgi:ketosteroid isomerase-like protein
MKNNYNQKMKMIKNYKFLIVVALVLSLPIVYSCNQQDKNEIIESASLFDIKQGEASILQANQRLIKSFKEKDSLKAVTCYSQDAKIMLAGQPSIEGTPNVISYISGLMDKGINKLDLKTEKIWGDSSILAEVGTYKISKGDSLVDKGKYIVLWKPEAGNWKIFRDMRNSDLPLSSMQKINPAAQGSVKKKR